MKVISKKEMIEQTITQYIAEDGSIFNDKKLCEQYEIKTKLKQLEEKIQKLQTITKTPPWCENDHVWKWYKAKNKNDVKNICEYYNSFSPSNYINCDSVVLFPTWICVEEGYDGDVWVWGSLLEYDKDYQLFVELFKNHA